MSEEALINDSISYRTIDAKTKTYSINRAGFTVEFAEPTTINCIVLREAIHLGQTIQAFSIRFFDEENKVGEISGTTIGRKRILTFPAKKITAFKVYLNDRMGNDNISGVAAYLIDEKLVEK